MTSSKYVDVPDNHFLLNTLSIIYFWKTQAKLSSMMPNIISKRSKKTKVSKVANVSNVAKVAKVAKVANVANVSKVSDIAKVEKSSSRYKISSIGISCIISINISFNNNNSNNNNTELSTNEVWHVSACYMLQSILDK